MKKIFAIALAAVLAASVSSCGGKSSGSSDRSTSETSSQESPDASPLSDEDAAKALGYVANVYTMNGIAKLGSKIPEEFDKEYEEVRERINSQPLSISGDGVLKFDGKEYQLIPQAVGDEAAVFGVKGSGFSIKSYNKKKNVASKDYEGVAAVTYEVQHGTINGEDWPMKTVEVLISTDATESYAVSISLSPEDE